MPEPFGDIGLERAEATAYRGQIGGEEAGSGINRVEPVEIDGRGYLRQLLEMTVLGDAEYRAEIVFRRDRGDLVCESYRAETSHRGERIAVEEGRFRAGRALHWGGELRAFPRDLAPLLGCAVALRGIGFSPRTRHSFSLWLANSVYWEVDLRVERTERIVLPVGELPAWRVRARPSFWHVARPLDRLIQLVLPPFVLHFDERPPHRFVRFEFPTGPFPWNPRGLIEATDLDPS